MNPDITRLKPYPFERLLALKQGLTPNPSVDAISMSIGEPKHPTPSLINQEVISHLQGLSNYPITKGGEDLRRAGAQWLCQRFDLPDHSIDENVNIVPVNGTREGIFSFVQCVVDRTANPLVLLPNPFYQIYEGATLLSGAQPWFLNTTTETGFLPDFDQVPEQVWQRCQLVFICTPGNPTGAVMQIPQLQQLIRLSDQYDFVIASDECYSEIYRDEDNPPPSLLSAARQMGRIDYHRCVVFHSLSKRSNAPGLRSGLVAGDADIIGKYLHYRTYHGCAMPQPFQAASIKAWQDEKHVIEGRRQYREKFEVVLSILGDSLKLEYPPAGFYLWPETPIDDEDFTRQLYQQKNVTVLPGSYLSRTAHGINPGHNRIRMALVAPLDECIDAAKRIRDFVYSL